jgi:secreted trypsin-like serine protease
MSRYKGEQRIINLVNALSDGYNVMLTNNPGMGNGVGGTCNGDSGGPILVKDSNLIVGINSFGMAPWCKGNDYGYRVDILNSYEFLNQFVDVLP